jgi:hypothetical protein
MLNFAERILPMKYEKREALRIKVELLGDIDEYAKSFLAIYNNVKNDHDLLKMYNDYGNNVYVVCEKNVENAAIEFLEQFGNIVSTENVEVVQPIGYDYEYRDDIDTEFLEVEEL